MLAAVSSALPLTLRDAPAAFVNAPPELSTSVVALLEPESCVPDPDVMVTTGAVKLRPVRLAAAVLPRVTSALPALKLATPPTLMAPLL